MSNTIELNFVHLYHRTLPVQRLKSDEDKNTRKNSQKRHKAQKNVYLLQEKELKFSGKRDNTKSVTNK